MTEEKKVKKSSFKIKQAKLFSTMEIRKDFKMREQLNLAVSKIENRMNDYKRAVKNTGIPWEIAGVLHYMECGSDLKRQLLNGERWSIKTTMVPVGLGPFSSFEESCVEAFKKVKNKDWTVAGALEFCEKWNGLGYRKHHSDINTPYLWSFSNHYFRGKYTSDGHFDPEATSKQVGAALILRSLGYANEHELI